MDTIRNDADRKADETPKVDLLEALLTVYTLEQLVQLYRQTLRARESSRGGQAEVVVRWMNGKPRYLGVLDWDEMVSPKSGPVATE